MSRLLRFEKKKGSFWFKLFGFGLLIRDGNVHPLCYGEQNGISKYLELRGRIITFLKPR